MGVIIAMLGGLLVGLLGGTAIGMGLAYRIQSAEREHNRRKQNIAGLMNRLTGP